MFIGCVKVISSTRDLSLRDSTFSPPHDASLNTCGLVAERLMMEVKEVTFRGVPTEIFHLIFCNLMTSGNVSTQWILESLCSKLVCSSMTGSGWKSGMWSLTLLRRRLW